MIIKVLFIFTSLFLGKGPKFCLFSLVLNFVLHGDLLETYINSFDFAGHFQIMQRGILVVDFLQGLHYSLQNRLSLGLEVEHLVTGCIQILLLSWILQEWLKWLHWLRAAEKHWILFHLLRIAWRVPDRKFIVLLTLLCSLCDSRSSYYFLKLVA